MPNLVKEVFHFEVATEQEADQLIEEKKNSSPNDFSFSRKYKEKTSKGEVLGSWYEVKIEISYPENKMKENF